MIQIIYESDENANGGNAVVVIVYQLKNADKFIYSNFETLIITPEISLGTDLVNNSKFEKIIAPGEKSIVKELEIKDETVFIGIIADFYLPATEGWKHLIPLDKDFDKLFISIHENSISVEKDD